MGWQAPPWRRAGLKLREGKQLAQSHTAGSKVGRIPTRAHVTWNPPASFPCLHLDHSEPYGAREGILGRGSESLLKVVCPCEMG